MPMTNWTDEATQTLRSMVDAGATSGEIATQLGITRNAVIGKITRSGLQLTTPSHATMKARAAKARAAKAVRTTPLKKVTPMLDEQVPVFEPPPPAPDPAEDCTVSIWDAAPGQCRWPINSPTPIDDFRFCGRPTVSISYPYCHTHFAKMYHHR
jgi:GcrA cell cycle regulator